MAAESLSTSKVIEARRVVPKDALVLGHRIAHGMEGIGIPVLLVHGTPSSSYIWRNVRKELLDRGFQVFILDLLGYGLSERPWNPEVDTSVTGQVAVLKELMKPWRINKFHLVAHDIGGAIAQRYALEYPDEVLTLTLIDTVSFDSWPSERTHKQMQAGLERLINTTDTRHREHFREWLLSTVDNKERFKRGALDTFLAFISNPIGQASLFQHQVRFYDPKHTDELTPRIAELGQRPVQLIWGEEDTWQVRRWAEELHRAIPGSVLNMLSNCGHFAMEDQPKAVTQLIETFIKKQIKDGLV